MSCRGSLSTTSDQEVSVHITVVANYVHSDPVSGRHWFSYRITIQNDGSGAVRLLSRYWRITDGDNQVREVSGDGVVGKQPRIDDGKTYQYTSYVDFSTPVGYMEGHYTMETEHGRRFPAKINLFSLSLPDTIH